MAGPYEPRAFDGVAANHFPPRRIVHLPKSLAGRLLSASGNLNHERKLYRLSRARSGHCHDIGSLSRRVPDRNKRHIQVVGKCLGVSSIGFS